MKVPLLDLRAQFELHQEELEQAALEVIRSQQFVMGPRVEQLEQELAALIDTPHAIACASGTDALILAMKALDLQKEDEVIVPAFTFFASAGAVWNAGATPVFCDVDPASFNTTAELIAQRITARTRAVMVVHLYGQMAELQPIAALARQHGLTLIEDAAQSIGAVQQIGGKARSAGSVGDVGCFSFFPTKNLGAFGDGGLITTADQQLADKLRKLRLHGGRQMYHHEYVGTNSRLDALQAAVLSTKLPHLQEWTEARRRNAAAYDAAFAGLTQVATPVVTSGNQHVYNQYTLRVERRDALAAHLNSKGVGTGIYYPVPLHLQECFLTLGQKAGSLPFAEQACREVLSLPVYPELSAAQQEYVIETVRDFYINDAK